MGKDKRARIRVDEAKSEAKIGDIIINRRIDTILNNFKRKVYIVGLVIGTAGLIVALLVDIIRSFPVEYGGFQVLGIAGFGLIVIFCGTMLGKVIKK